MKNSNIKSALSKLINYLKDNLAIIIIALIFSCLGALLTIIGPNKIGEIATLIQQGYLTGIDVDRIAKLGIFLLIVYILSALFIFLQQYIMAKVTLKMAYNMRNDISQKINNMPQEYFNNHYQGDILSRVTNDVSTLQQGLTNSLPTIISASTQFIGCLIMMFVTEWHLALISICVTLIGLVLVVIIMKRSQKYFIKRQESLGVLNGYVEEMYTCHDLIRVSLAEDDVLNKFDSLNEEVYDSNWKSQFLSGIMQPLMNIIGNVAYVCVCVFGAILALNGTIDFGVIIAFIVYVRLFTSPLTQIAQGLTNMQTSSASAHRIFDFLESKELEKEDDKIELKDQIKGNVEFKHVQFAYPDNLDKIIIKDFSCSIKSGQKIAIVGPTGAGKTTMVNLLMKFYNVNKGSISIDGHDIKSLKREDVHNMFSMVLQDTWLFEGTIRENLVYNMENIDDETIYKVCKDCGLEKFIRLLPNGLDTIVSESLNISSGQKQLLTIARAMLQNSPMMILDEATSSVDTRTEEYIQKAMDKLTENKTSFVIAHRLSTIKNASLILVMNNGDVIESGNHEELMKKNGFYANLYNSQFDKA